MQLTISFSLNAALAALAVAWLSHILLVGRLRKQHIELWRRLGMPRWLSFERGPGTWNLDFLKFIWRGPSLAKIDTRAHALVLLLRAAQVATLVAVAALFVVFFSELDQEKYLFWRQEGSFGVVVSNEYRANFDKIQLRPREGFKFHTMVTMDATKEAVVSAGELEIPPSAPAK